MNLIAEIGLSTVFQSVCILNAWSLFYLLFFANFIQCTVQTARYDIVQDKENNRVYYKNYPIAWQYIPDSIVNLYQPPDSTTTEKNKKTTLYWLIAVGVFNALVIGLVVFAHYALKLNTKEFLLKNSILFLILGGLEGIFFFFVGWFDFPISQAKGASDYLTEIVNNIQQM